MNDELADELEELQQTDHHLSPVVEVYVHTDMLMLLRKFVTVPDYMTGQMKPNILENWQLSIFN